MGFSPKRLKQLAEGKVVYQILDGEKVLFQHKSFIVAVQMADQMQKTNPSNNYTMKVVALE